MAFINFQIQIFLFCVLFTQSVLGLKCYICNSANDPECAMPHPPAKFLLECSSDTLEILNDMHRQTKINEAVHLASLLNGTTDAGSHAPMPGQPGIDDAATAGRPPAPHPFDKDDKDLTLNRTARSAENGADGAKPAVFSTSPINLPKKATFCRKTSYHIPAQLNGPNSTLKASVRVLRSCGWIPEPTKEGEQPHHSGCKWIGTEGVQMDQCVCSSGDGCNSGNYLQSLTSQTLILMAVMTFGYFYVL